MISREQAIAAGLTARAIAYRLVSGQWQVLMPDVYLTHRGEPSREQRLTGALLFAGPRSAVDAADACHFYGLRAVEPEPGRVHVVVPWGEPARSRGFVVVRRTTRPFITVAAAPSLRYLDAAGAVIAAARTLRSERHVTALLSEAVQRGVTTHSGLIRAHLNGPSRGSRLTSLALGHVGAGARSAPEAAFRTLAEASAVLPPLVYNGVLRLPGGQLVSPDALDVGAGIVHETNGRVAHARDDLFDDMQRRHDAMTAAGLVVLHNTPRRIYADGHAVIREFERCHQRYAGRGLPPGVELLRATAG